MHKLKDWIHYNIGFKPFLAIVGLIIVIAGYRFCSEWYKTVQYQKTTTETVTNIFLKKVLAKHLYETINKEIGYQVSYQYQVNGNIYSKTEIIEPSSEAKHLFDNFTTGKTCFVQISCTSESPTECIITKPLLD